MSQAYRWHAVCADERRQLADPVECRVSNAGATGSEVIRAALARYLDMHPDACDTADGICGWWLPSAGVVAMKHEVERVLEHMVREGLLRRVALPGGGALYAAGSGAAGSGA